MSLLRVPSDDELVLFNNGSGGWERRRMSDWSFGGASSAGFGAHQAGGLPSDDGAYFTATNGDSTIPVWKTEGATDPDHSGTTAVAPIHGPNSLVLSPDGSTLAVADSGVIYVAPVARDGASRGPTVKLAGNGSINSDGVRFFGDNAHLLSASGDQVALWDLTQRDRIAHSLAAPIQPGCSACTGPRVAMSPDGKSAAILVGFGDSVVIQPLPGVRGRRELSDGGGVSDYAYAQPVWLRDGRHVVLALSPPIGGSAVSVPTGLPGMIRAWPAGRGSDFVVTAALSGAGDAVIVVNDRGDIYLQDAGNGSVRGTVAGPPELGTGSSNRLGGAAIQSSSGLVAMIHDGAVRVVDAHGGKIVGEIDGSDASHVTFAGGHLLVQRSSGRLEVWDARASRLERTLAGDASYTWQSVGNAQGTLVARQRSDGSIVLSDLDTGAVLDTYPVPDPSDVRKTGIAFSPDGSHLVTVTEGPGGGGDGEVVVRDISTAALIRAACSAAGRELSAAEWQSLVGAGIPRVDACG
jgi:WD40 repeat protein